ncbi:MAG: hypothetical protein Q9191_001133 [Dirinaria sp. TL-2023a]
MHLGFLLVTVLLPILRFAFADEDSVYAPVTVKCSGTLVRDAKGIAKAEKDWVTKRKEKTDKALADWIQKTNPEFDTAKLPTVALAHSGGGYRAMLTGAGLIKGFDSRDTKVSTSGILQGITYQAGLSGGAWLLSGLIGNNYPTVSKIVKDYWKETLEAGALIPDDDLFDTFEIYDQIEDDLDVKEKAGFDATIVDLYGLLLSNQFLPDERWAGTLSQVTQYSAFKDHSMPFPIVTALGPPDPGDECVADKETPSYEFTPYEFGSWDKGVAAFTQTKFLGTNMTNGNPSEKDVCTTNYDKLGYIMGCSSNFFNLACATYQLEKAADAIRTVFFSIVEAADDPFIRDEYAIFRNPFYKWKTSSLVNKQEMLYLVDGGEGGQNVPIESLLQPSRNVDVIIVGDNSDDTDEHWPDGSTLFNTYKKSKDNGLDRMPEVPEPKTFVKEGMNTHPTFFGCHDKDKVTIVYLPNVGYATKSNVATTQLVYDAKKTEAMIENGVQIATMGDHKAWAECLGCALMEKMDVELPEACGVCWEGFCYNS